MKQERGVGGGAQRSEVGAAGSGAVGGAARVRRSERASEVDGGVGSSELRASTPR